MTLLVHNIPEFAELEIPCPGNHEHLPWGAAKVGGKWTFATADEAAYPEELCSKMAKKICRRAVINGVEYLKVPSAVLPADRNTSISKPLTVTLEPSHSAAQKAEAGRQARGNRAPCVVPEHAKVAKIHVGGAVFDSFDIQMPVINLVEPLYGDDSSDSIPIGSRFLRKNQDKCGKGGDLFFATPWDQFSFLEKARSAVHPFDSTASQDQEVYVNIFEMLVEGHDAVELEG